MRERMVIKPSLLVAVAVTLAASMLGAPVVAASPHFIGTPQIAKISNGGLSAFLKAAGLGNIVTTVFLTSSGGTATLQCVNPGGNSPAPKKVDFGPLQGRVVTVTPRNGQITVTPFLPPPPLPSASQICPNSNWGLQLLSLTYLNVVLHIQQNNVDILTFNFGSVDP